MPTVETYHHGPHAVSVHRFEERRSGPCRTVVHDHDVLTLQIAGESRFWLRGQYAIRTGDVLLVPAGEPHYSLAGAATNPKNAIGLCLCCECLRPVHQVPLSRMFDAVRNGGCALRRLPIAEANRLRGLIVGIDEELKGTLPSYELAVDAMLGHIAVLLLRAELGSLPDPEAGANGLVAPALTFIRQNACTGLSLSDVAKHVSRTPAHVASVVKNETGESVLGWIRRVRLREARHLLVHTDETIEAIAERCGFSGPSHFHREFKSVEGTAPGTWRRNRRS